MAGVRCSSHMETSLAFHGHSGCQTPPWQSAWLPQPAAAQKRKQQARQPQESFVKSWQLGMSIVQEMLQLQLQLHMLTRTHKQQIH
jgi:hypothetical protein